MGKEFKITTDGEQRTAIVACDEDVEIGTIIEWFAYGLARRAGAKALSFEIRGDTSAAFEVGGQKMTMEFVRFSDAPVTDYVHAPRSVFAKVERSLAAH